MANYLSKKPRSHKQYQKSSVLTCNIKKAQFSLTTSKKGQFSLATSKSLILTSNIKSPIYVDTILSKAQDY